jgi:hypothetical protein
MVAHESKPSPLQAATFELTCTWIAHCIAVSNPHSVGNKSLVLGHCTSIILIDGWDRLSKL